MRSWLKPLTGSVRLYRTVHVQSYLWKQHKRSRAAKPQVLYGLIRGHGQEAAAAAAAGSAGQSVNAVMGGRQPTGPTVSRTCAQT